MSVRSRSLRRFALTLSALGLVGAALLSAQDTAKRGRKYKAPPPTAHVEVTVTRATNGKPVENASVIFHPLVDGRDNGNMELKTNDDGKASIDLLELGSSVRVQIIASGFQTYGEDYKIDKDTVALAVKLHRPTEQYSIYKKHSGEQGGGDDEVKPPVDPKAAPDAQSTPGPQSEPQKDAPKTSDQTPGQQDSKPQPSTNPN